MSDEVWAEVKQKLMQAPFDMKQEAGVLRKGKCQNPACGKKTLWSKYADKPGRVYCDRQNKCGYTATAKELFPDLFDAKRVVKEYPPSPENPNATADAYLKKYRGFSIERMRGWYQQQAYDFRPREAIEANLSAESVVSVRFNLPEPMQGSWDRFLDGDHFEKKTYLLGGSKLNKWMWTPPGQKLSNGDDLYVTEGIFDAISLKHSGRNAAAIMGATNKPQAFVDEHRALRLHYIVALDNDVAGKKAARGLVIWLRKQGEKVSCIQPSDDSKVKKDWNDLLLEGKLESTDFDNYFYYGQLLTAASAESKALLMYHRKNAGFFVFEYQRQTHVWSIDMAAYEKAVERVRKADKLEEDEPLSDEQRDEALKSSKSVSLLCNAGIDFLYTQNNPVTEELFYYFRLRHADGRVTLNTLTGTQLSAVGDFRKRLLSMGSGGALFHSNAKAHAWLLTRWMNDIRNIDVVGYVGYSADHQAWVFPNFAVYQNRLIQANAEDYVELSPKSRVKSAYHNVDLKVNFDLTEYSEVDWLSDVYIAWGVKGIMALAYFTLSLFTQQVRDFKKNMHFMELVGDPGTGKSTLIEFLWSLFGRVNYEGFDPTSSNPAFVARSLNQVANLPVVMIEGDRDNHHGAFDWSNIKKLYNGRSYKGRGVKTQGNETYEPPFFGSLVISQNRPVDAEQAVLERIVHCYFHKKDTSEASLSAAKRLVAMPSEQLSGYLIKCLTQADKLLDTFKKWQPIYERKFKQLEGHKTFRLAETHSEIAAAMHMLTLVTPMDNDMLDEATSTVADMCLQREKSISREHPDVEQFFELIDYLATKGTELNHRSDGVVVNLNEVYEAAHKYGHQLQMQVKIKPLLKNSQRFNGMKMVYSQRDNRSLRCWMFKEAA